MSGLAGLVPASVEAAAEPTGRMAAAWSRHGFGLLMVGFAWLIPAFVEPRFAIAMVVWDGLVLAAWVIDLRRLPRPAQLTVRRSWLGPPSLSVASRIQLTVHNSAADVIRVRLLDTVPGELRNEPPEARAVVPGRTSIETTYDIRPARRGEAHMGWVFIRYASRWQIAERWARAPLAQSVVTCPDLDEARRQAMFLIRSRQIELEKRSTRRRGAGRAFESLREQRTGDDFRDICWTASARRGKLVTRQYEIERRQTIWMLFDSGRLMRTRIGALSKLDLAVNAGLSLAEVALASGDQVGVLTYARRVTARLPAGSGRAHLGRIVDRLAVTREEEWEADHVQAASRLLIDQKRRSLVVWLTDLAETAMTPEVIRAASLLTARHVVLFVVTGQPDLVALAARRPERAIDMYESTAAQELIQRRAALLAKLRANGALTVEATSSRLAPALVNAYLEVKQRGVL